MGLKYRHLSERDRVLIELSLEQGLAPARIASILRVHRSTVGREIRRGKHPRLDRYLSVNGSHAYASGRKRAGLARRKLGSDLSCPAWQSVLMGLRAGWSPEQIYGRSRHIDHLLGLSASAVFRVSHETIYKAIFDLPHSPQRAQITSLLRQSTGARRRSRKRKSRFTGIQNITPISQRPVSVLLRDVPGHWEGDTVRGAGGKSLIGTLVERSSRFTLILHLRNGSAAEFHRAVVSRLREFPAHLRRSITYDRGTEMALHESICNDLRLPVFFCEPYSPWQRPTNENTNGLLRQYLPKGFDLSLISPAQLQVIENALNHRPRRILRFRTPHEVLQQFL